MKRQEILTQWKTAMITFNPDTGEVMLGDIIISVDKVKEQAEAYRPFGDEGICFFNRT